MVGQVGNRNVAPGEAELLRGMNDELGLAGGEIDRLNIGPMEAPADGFEESFFGGESGGQMLEPAFLAFGIGDLSRCKNPVYEPRIPFDRSLDAGDLDDVDADAVNHDSVHFIQILAIWIWNLI